MTLGSIKELAGRGRGRALALLTVVALACPACASKEKVTSGPASGMGAGMAPPPLTAGYDPARQVASGRSGMPWAASGPGMAPSAAEGSPFSR